jgi:23S rRNA (pseudouridine1915-N3)-methyltransferase
MKFSEIDEAGWAELQPFLDTCLLPVSGLTGEETPAEATARVANTGDWLSPLEQAFNGRTVTMPAFHYYSGDAEDRHKLDRLCGKLKKSGFRYVILVCGRPNGLADVNADLLIQPVTEDEQPDEQELRKAVAELWRRGRSESLEKL